MLSPRGLSASFAVLGLALAATSFSHAGDIFKAKLYPEKKGTIADFQPMSSFCGTKPIKVAYSDGWGGNYGATSHAPSSRMKPQSARTLLTLATPTAKFKREKQIADIEGLVAQKYDVIVAQLDGGAAIESHARGDRGRRGCGA